MRSSPTTFSNDLDFCVSRRAYHKLCSENKRVGGWGEFTFLLVFLKFAGVAPKDYLPRTIIYDFFHETLPLKRHVSTKAIVCYTSVFSVVPQRTSLPPCGRNGCVADYKYKRLWTLQRCIYRSVCELAGTFDDARCYLWMLPTRKVLAKINFLKKKIKFQFVKCSWSVIKLSFVSRGSCLQLWLSASLLQAMT